MAAELATLGVSQIIITDTGMNLNFKLTLNSLSVAGRRRVRRRLRLGLVGA